MEPLPPDADPENVFSLTPTEIAAVERVWRAQAALLGEASTDGFVAAQGESSRVLRALRDADPPVRRALGSIADRLAAMTDAVHLLAGRAADSDARSAAALERMTDR